MIDLAINILWLLIGIIVLWALCGSRCTSSNCLFPSPT